VCALRVAVTKMATVDVEPVERITRGRQRFNLLMCSGGLVGIGAVLWFFVHTRAGQSFDSRALRGQDLQSPRLIRGSSTFVQYGLRIGFAVVCVLAIMAVVRGDRVAVVFAALSGFGSFFTTQALKVIVSRPILVAVTVDDRRPNSFPSGHSTAALGIAVACVILCPGATKLFAVLAAAPYAAAIEVCTLFARWHRPSDVFGAVFVVLFWTFAALFGTRWFPVREQPARGVRSVIIAELGLVLLASIGVATTRSMTASGLRARRLIVDVAAGRNAEVVGASFDLAATAMIILTAAFLGVLLASCRPLRSRPPVSRA
jgi:membrane-associated phospholipid phosphatase